MYPGLPGDPGPSRVRALPRRYASSMNDQLLRDILSELKKMNKKLDDLATAVNGVEQAVWESE